MGHTNLAQYKGHLGLKLATIGNPTDKCKVFCRKPVAGFWQLSRLTAQHIASVLATLQ